MAKPIYFSDSLDGGQLIVVATLGTPAQPTKEAQKLWDYARSLKMRCYSCKRDFPSYTFDASTHLCEECFEDAGLENAHFDGDCDVRTCKFCKAEYDAGCRALNADG